MEFSIAEFLAAVGLALICSVKFAMTVPALPIKYTFAESLMIALGGGLTGTIFFYYGGTWALDKLAQFKIIGRNKPKKTMTKRNRTIVRVKQRFGLIGIAFLTPVLISIPIGAVVAARYFRADKRTLPIMLTAVIFWAFVFTSLSPFFVELLGLEKAIE